MRPRVDYVEHAQCGEYVFVDEWEEHVETCWALTDPPADSCVHGT